jgi:type III secretion protein N (ATPase)
VVVVAHNGERGREVREFLEHQLGPEGRKRAVIVVATSDSPAMERVKAAYAATAIAEHFRYEGKQVLLLMDSLTRFARAQREIGLAAGEPPTRRGSTVPVRRTPASRRARRPGRRRWVDHRHLHCAGRRRDRS